MEHVPPPLEIAAVHVLATTLNGAPGVETELTVRLCAPTFLTVIVLSDVDEAAT